MNPTAVIVNNVFREYKSYWPLFFNKTTYVRWNKHTLKCGGSSVIVWEFPKWIVYGSNPCNAVSNTIQYEYSVLNMRSHKNKQNTFF